jgi:hypothetical protein
MHSKETGISGKGRFSGDDCAETLEIHKDGIDIGPELVYCRLI